MSDPQVRPERKVSPARPRMRDAFALVDDTDYLGYCPTCGRDVQATFCDHCGREVQPRERER